MATATANKEQDPSAGSYDDSGEPQAAADSSSGRRMFATDETRAVTVIRLLTGLVLVAVAATVCALIFVFTADSEKDDFEAQFGHHAEKVVDQFRVNSQRRLDALESLSLDFTSWQEHSNETFPLLTLPDLERKAAFTLELAQVLSVMTFPVVENRTAWEGYSVENQGWLTEGLALQTNVKLKGEAGDVEEINAQGTGSGDPYTDPSITPFIFNADGYEEGPGPYAPIWQMAPALPVPALINFNSFRHPSWERSHTAFKAVQSAMVGPATDYADDQDPQVAEREALMNLFLNRWPQKNEYQDGPVSDLYIPIWDSYGEDRKLASIMNCWIWWQLYFAQLLPEDAKVLVVLENTCEQSFTYRIDGEKATYLGQGELYDDKYEHLMMQTGFGALIGSHDVDLDNQVDGQCFYNVRVYPTSEMEDDYSSNEPLIFTLTLFAVLVFTTLVFITYDFLVQRRRNAVNLSAEESNAVVSSLFPDAVRDRASKVYKNNSNSNIGANSKSVRGRDLVRALSSVSDDVDMDDSVPIAELYEDCTVLFADIAGFTAWSSVRSPQEVFKLLETIYGAFDKVAKRRRVYKIETIGDCYVAVTGLPTAQPDNAVIMAKFANDCITRLSQLMPMLVERLGPDTECLAMRFGLHSGPVTAGVLRGEKARFQLFGDTVNTAARMESNGQRNRIHVSGDTAEKLRQAGKEDWLSAREDKIVAKGKGEMQTYWVEVTVSANKSVSSMEDLGL